MFAYKASSSFYNPTQKILACSFGDFLELIVVVLEWNNVLVPAGQSAGDLQSNELSEPGNVGNLLLLQLQVSVETTVVEAFLEGN